MKKSPLNKGRSLERNRRKQARGKENREYRAGLHREKASGRDRAEVQGRIDQISRRG